MKRILSVSNLILTFAIVFLFSGICSGQNPELKKECETKAVKAAQLINKLGAQPAFEKISDPNGSFAGKNSHVFGINSETGKLMVHKIKAFVGVNMHNYRSSDNAHPYTEILKTAVSEDKGWVTYMTFGSGPERREKAELKHMHFFKVPTENIILCVGYWNDH